MIRPNSLLSLGATVLFAALPGLAHGQGFGTRQQGWHEDGEASWYGPRHAGLRTSSGEVFDPARMTAAHSSLPLGSRVRVTMRDTGESVVVTINDRQPPHGVRIIDLSMGAASYLGFVRRGKARVTLSPADAAAPVEVASAPEDAGPDAGAASRPRRDRRHTPPVRPTASAVH